jgi:hypothetical protein
MGNGGGRSDSIGGNFAYHSLSKGESRVHGTSFPGVAGRFELAGTVYGTGRTFCGR